jgi:hypothetical protein
MTPLQGAHFKIQLLKNITLNAANSKQVLPDSKTLWALNTNADYLHD